MSEEFGEFGESEKPPKPRMFCHKCGKEIPQKSYTYFLQEFCIPYALDRILCKYCTRELYHPSKKEPR